MKNQSFVRSISGNLAIAMNRFAGMKTTFALVLKYASTKVPHLRRVTRTCQIDGGRRRRTYRSSSSTRPYGETRGTFVAEADTYGADKLWLVLKPIPIDVEAEA